MKKEVSLNGVTKRYLSADFRLSQLDQDGDYGRWQIRYIYPLKASVALAVGSGSDING